MTNISKALLDLSEMERLAAGDSFVHRLDPRCKIAVVLLFSATVASFERHEVMALIPFFSLPLFFLVVSDASMGYLAKKLAVVSLFAFAVAIANPFIDTSPAFRFAGISISGGWLSFISIMMRFALTASCALLLLATTGLRDLTAGLEGLGAPRVFAAQLFFLCRSIFLLSDEAARMSKGRDARTIGRRGGEFSISARLLTTLLTRSLDRSERVYAAMRGRGFNGSMPVSHKSLWKTSDTLFLLVWLCAFVAFRFSKEF